MTLTFRTLFAAVWLAVPIWGWAQSCDDIKDKDKANYCRAVNANEASFCKKIADNDKQNLCLGKIENDVKFCKRIRAEKIKKRCENSIRS